MKFLGKLFVNTIKARGMKIKKIVFLILIVLFFICEEGYSDVFTKCMERCKKVKMFNPYCTQICESYVDCRRGCKVEKLDLKICDRICEPDPDWIFIATIPEKAFYFVNTKERYWRLYIGAITLRVEPIKKGKKEIGENIDYFIQKVVIDCELKRFRTIGITLIYLDGSYENIDLFERWIYASPGTLGEILVNIFCRTKSK